MARTFPSLDREENQPAFVENEPALFSPRSTRCRDGVTTEQSVKISSIRAHLCLKILHQLVPDRFQQKNSCQKQFMFSVLINKPSKTSLRLQPPRFKTLRRTAVFHKSRVQSKRPKTVLSRQEINSIFARLSDPWKLICQVAYGGGLRQMATLRLRVKDLDFAHGTIEVHDAKGGKHRMVPLPKRLESKLQRHLEKLEAQHEQNLAVG
jgi:integrase